MIGEFHQENPFARAMLGKGVGEEFEFKDKKYVIESITVPE